MLNCEIIVRISINMFLDSQEKIAQSIIKFYWYHRLFGGK
jgi:hypothetical protein